MRTTLGTLVALLSLLVSGGCDKPCTPETCPNGCCVAGLCTPSLDLTCGVSGGQCVDCAQSGLRCSEGACACQPEGSGCSTPTQCCSGHCNQSRCVACAQNGFTCQQDTDCCGELSCNLGTCRPRPACGSPGEACGQTAPCCPGRICEQAVCRYPCGARGAPCNARGACCDGLGCRGGECLECLPRG